MTSNPDTPAQREAESQRFKRQRHTWECLNRTRIGSWEHDACNCPEDQSTEEDNMAKPVTSDRDTLADLLMDTDGKAPHEAADAIIAAGFCRIPTGESTSAEPVTSQGTVVRPVPAAEITIDHTTRALFIDGRPFAWDITDDGPHIERRDNPDETLTRVTLTLLAEDVHIIGHPDYVAARDDHGNIRLNNGFGLLVAAVGDDRADIEGWHQRAKDTRFRRQYAAALDLLDREQAAAEPEGAR